MFSKFAPILAPIVICTTLLLALITLMFYMSGDQDAYSNVTSINVPDGAKVQPVLEAGLDDAGNLSIKTASRTVEIHSENNKMKNFVLPEQGDDIIYENIGETHDPEYVLLGVLKQ